MKIVSNILKLSGFAVYALCGTAIVLFLMPIGGWKALNVLTGSMQPAIDPGDLVFIHSIRVSDLRAGDVITYSDPNHPNRTITHRLVSKESKDGLTMVRTKGDSNTAPDPQFAAGRILGVMAFRIPVLGSLMNIVRHPLGLAALVIIPGLIVMWAEWRKLRLLMAKPLTNQTHEQAPPPPPPPTPPAAPTQSPRPRPQQSKSLDGMRRIAILTIGVGVFMLGGGSTFALTNTNKVSIASRINVVAQVPHDKDDCKKQHWRDFTNPDGSQRFKNQGRCIAYVVSKGAKGQ